MFQTRAIKSFYNKAFRFSIEGSMMKRKKFISYEDGIKSQKGKLIEKEKKKS